jgi:hypothetical protein
MYHIFFIQSSVDVHLGWFRRLATVNSANIQTSMGLAPLKGTVLPTQSTSWLGAVKAICHGDQEPLSSADPSISDLPVTFFDDHSCTQAASFWPGGTFLRHGLTFALGLSLHMPHLVPLITVRDNFGGFQMWHHFPPPKNLTKNREPAHSLLLVVLGASAQKL